MGDRSLQSSRWAPKNQFQTSSSNREFADDWRCLSCSFSNFQWRKKCFRCSTPKGQGAHVPTTNGLPISISPDLPQNWEKEPAVKSSLLHGLNPTPKQPSFKPVEHGLATSRWAPRRQSHGEPLQVWTRTVSSAKPTRPCSPSKSFANKSVSPDLGFPYQVQHYILALVQRILEEGCYDFAARWLPQVLNEKGWDCPEAVELSIWKSFLPNALPPNAIKPLSNYTLEAALADAVRTRNRAVHRHLCDNNEIRQMTLQAQDLMSMFSDTTRQNKFHQLWAELNVWNSKDDALGARTRLERALREISERPMDDMDWTPNAVSLEELHASSGEVQNTPELYTDEMELD
ncbi:uncharacterized protein LY89DRAFT_618900 [Mollisia scopiformis]|uniref:RanBP2-type domain-containing protein n=1 Tax=Mollisia scopiformis TaxID=149040 RepID=A0A194X7M3_MOLSC|nr:uncharacterized protein LY89DRAFT_618900 [Mollisia scopiformis]KUJ16104.1 hypothetical protein LY89DRAFT_618900 [Mollisia scopiformis]